MCSPSLPHIRDCPHGDLSYDVLLQSWHKVTVGSSIQQQTSELLHLSCFVLCAQPRKDRIHIYVKRIKFLQNLQKNSLDDWYVLQCFFSYKSVMGLGGGEVLS